MTRARTAFTLIALALAVPAALVAQAPAKTPTAAKPKTPTQSKLQKEATITLEAATATAQGAVPTGKIQSHELEREDGKLIYSFDIKIAGKKGIEEVNVDAMTGVLIEKVHETPADEAKEAAAEKKGAPKKAPVQKAGGGI